MKWILTLVALSFSGLALFLSFSQKSKSSMVVHSIGTYRKATYSIPNKLSPLSAVSSAEQAISSLLYEGLVALNDDLTIRPAIAKQWTLSQDGIHYLFNLDDSKIFHDGSKLDATSVKWSIEALLASNTHGSHFKRISEVRAIGSHKLELVLNRPDPNLLSKLASPFAKVFKENLPYSIGSGAFEFGKLKVEDGVPSKLVLNGNRHYPQVFIDRMEIIKFDPSISGDFLFDQKIHDAILLAPLVPRSVLPGAYLKIIKESAQTWVIAMNNSKGPTQDINVRRCLRNSINTHDLVATILKGHRPANNYIPEFLLGEYTTKDKAGCNGLPDTGKSLVLAIPKEVPTASKLCDFFLNSWSRFRQRIECRVQPFDEMIKDVSNKDFQMSLMGITLDMLDSSYFASILSGESSFDIVNAKNIGLDKLVKEIVFAQNSQKKIELFRTLEDLINTDVLLIPISNPTETSLIHPCVKGLMPGIGGNHFLDYSQVSSIDDGGCSI